MQPIRNSAKAIIIENERLLVIKLHDEEGDWYCLPGGGQEPGETLQEALKRECREEINSEIAIGDLRFVREFIGKNHEFRFSQDDVHAIEFMFECRLASGAEPQPGHVPDTAQIGIEWLDVQWLDSYRLYPIGLRAVMPRRKERDVPIYMGDIN